MRADEIAEASIINATGHTWRGELRMAVPRPFIHYVSWNDISAKQY